MVHCPIYIELALWMGFKGFVLFLHMVLVYDLFIEHLALVFYELSSLSLFGSFSAAISYGPYGVIHVGVCDGY